MEKQQHKMNILMVTPCYFPYMGGIETHVYEVGRRLSSNGVNITLLTTVAHRSMYSLPKEDHIEGMRIIRVNAWPRQKDYYLAPEIYSVIKQGTWDLVHCQGSHTLVPPLAMFAAKKANIPYVLTFHTGGNSSGFRNAIRGTQWRMQRSLLAHASKLIGVSHFEAEYFCRKLHLPKELFTVVPNGSFLPDVTYSAPAKSTKLLIASIGRLEEYKGHQHLITALPKILEHRSDARLLILGVGPYESALHDLASKVGVKEYVTIRSVPAGDRKGMADILSQVALVTLLSRYEAHPIAVMEALALRRPVLVADTSGLREIAEKGFARMVALNSTPEEIAQAVLQQINDPLIPPAQLELPTWEDCVQQLYDIYSLCIRRKQCVS